jgi:hypothetical protein
MEGGRRVNGSYTVGIGKCVEPQHDIGHKSHDNQPRKIAERQKSMGAANLMDLLWSGSFARYQGHDVQLQHRC